eukprot:15479464-Alexandrium_andersonii.AAC.1
MCIRDRNRSDRVAPALIEHAEQCLKRAKLELHGPRTRPQTRSLTLWRDGFRAAARADAGSADEAGWRARRIRSSEGG